jgi:type II secretory pathway pseudopilin PulG
MILSGKNLLNKFKKNNGFTIVEAIIVVGILSLLVPQVAYLLVSVFSGSGQQYKSLDNIDTARIISSRFVNEIRSAVQGVDGSSAVSLAEENEIVFYSPWGSPDSSVRKIRYFFVENELFKGTTIPTGSPLSYDPDLENVTKIQSDLSLGEEALFYYYNGEYAGQESPLIQPVNINDVKFVRINLIVLKQTTKDSESKFVINTGSSIRSLKENLGD